PQHDDYKFLERHCVVGTLEEVAGHQMLDYLGVNIDSRYRRIHWRCPQVEQARSARPNKNNLPLNFLLRNFPGQYLPCGNIGCLVEVAELEINPARALGWHVDIADANMVEAGRLSKRRLATRVRCLKHVSRGILSNAKGFRGE